MLNRRHLLCCGAAAGLFTALAEPARAFPGAACPSGLPASLQPLVQQAFEGLDPHQLWDVHTHLLGTGDAGSGCTVNAQLDQWWHPVEMLRKRFILLGLAFQLRARNAEAYSRAERQRPASAPVRQPEARHG